ncbi:hypothetical protein HDU99_004481 [Rhizoclosmatium hyalinum]|nr:hypothetical protein HDU99_004481 [Rhizoclosmatium hyalinum]
MGLVETSRLAQLSPVTHDSKPVPHSEPTIKKWISQEILGTSISDSDFSDPFLLIQVLAILAPNSVNLNYYSSDHAFSCDDLNSVTVDMLFNGLTALGVPVQKGSKERVLNGDQDSVFEIARTLYEWKKGPVPDTLDTDHDSSPPNPSDFGVSEHVATPPSKAELAKIQRAGSIVSAIETDYEPSEASFIPSLRWLFRLILDETDGDQFGASYNCVEEVVEMARVLESITRSIPEGRILPALTYGAVYTMACKILFETSKLNKWIDTFIPPTDKAKQVDWVNQKGGFLDLLISNGLLDFQESLKSCIGDMIRDDCPFYESIHSNIIEALMQHSLHELRVGDIVEHISAKFPHMQTKDYPYDVEEALLLWFRQCANHAFNLTQDKRIISWANQKTDCNELTAFLHDGVAPSLVAFIYINGFKISEISFDGDLLSNWRLLDLRGKVDGMPRGCWRPEEIVNSLCLSSFDVAFLVYACEVFEWIELSNKIPIDEIVKTPEASVAASESHPVSPTKWMPIDDIEETPTEPKLVESPPSQQVKWLPIDDELFDKQQQDTPSSLMSLSTVSSSSNLDLVLEEVPVEKKSIKEENHVSTIKTTTIIQTASSSIVSQSEIVYQSFMQQFDEVVDAPSTGNHILHLERGDSVASNISTQDVYSTLEPKVASTTAIVPQQKAPPVTLVEPAKVVQVTPKAVAPPIVQTPQPKPVPSAKPTPPPNPPAAKTSSPKKSNAVNNLQPSSTKEPMAVAATADMQRSKNITAPSNATVATTTLVVNTAAPAPIPTAPPAKDRKRKLRDVNASNQNGVATPTTVELPKIQTPPPHHVASQVDISSPAMSTKSTITVTNGPPTSGRTTPDVLKLPPIPTPNSHIVTTTVTVNNPPQAQELLEEPYDSAAEDNRPPSFNLSDMIMSDESDPSSDLEYPSKKNPLLVTTTTTTVTTTTLKKPLKSSLKKQSVYYQQHLQQQQFLAAKLGGTTMSSSVTLVQEEEENLGAEDEWEEVVPRSHSGRKSIGGGSSNGGGRRRKLGTRKMVRVPVDVVMGKLQQQQQKSDVEDVGGVILEGEGLQENSTEKKEEVVPDTRNKLDLVLNGESSVTQAGTELPKFKGMLFVPLGEGSSYISLSDNESDGESGALDPPPFTQIPRRISARFESNRKASQRKSNSFIQQQQQHQQQQNPQPPPLPIKVTQTEVPMIIKSRASTTSRRSSQENLFTPEELPLARQQQPKPPKISTSSTSLPTSSTTSSSNNNISSSSPTTQQQQPSPEKPPSILKISPYKKPPPTNRQIIQNALTHVCLTPTPLHPLKDQVLSFLHASTWKHHILILKSASNHTYAGLCAYNAGAGYLEGVHGRVGQVVESEVEAYYRYDCGGRRFREVRSGGFAGCVDAIVVRGFNLK